jgi:hypothetical protein
MELIQLPKAMRNRGFTGWPQVYRVSKKEELPPPGISYVIAEEVDFALVFRLMIPNLIKQHGYFDWFEIYQGLTGQPYLGQRVYQRFDDTNGHDGEGHAYIDSDLIVHDVTLEQLSSDRATYVDLDMLSDLAMIPTFMTDIREAITVNVTNSYMWQDGYNKKTGICSGSLIEQPRARSLIILDISGSIPDGVSAGMLTLIKTMSEVTHADVIITGGSSYFYSTEEVRSLDIREVRRKINANNEAMMFYAILNSHDMDYENIITFGDSDHPAGFCDRKDLESLVFTQKISTKRWYSFFCMRHDTYGNKSEKGCGYGRWVKEANPLVERIDNTEWAKFFKPNAGL